MGSVKLKRPETLYDATTHYCPGCGHGIAHRLVAEVIDELGIREKTIGTAPVGCAVLLYDYFNCDIIECSHGRPPAVATAIKRVLPDRIVFTYQGDGDLAAIGTGETIHAANRGENITIIFVNNAIYGTGISTSHFVEFGGDKLFSKDQFHIPPRWGFEQGDQFLFRVHLAAYTQFVNRPFPGMVFPVSF